MHKLQASIDKQIEFNQSKNLFHEKFHETMTFSDHTLDAIQHLDKLDRKELKILIEYATEKALEEFCRVNQYFSFGKTDQDKLRNIYSQLVESISRKEVPAEIIAQNHYNSLKVWLQETNSFSQTMYLKKDAVLEPVACSEYSAEVQKKMFHLDLSLLPEPVLDIGCGKEGRLVENLRKEGLDAYGIDRFSDSSSYIKNANWFEFEYGVEKWGTILSNLGFSNHFIHHHLREDGNFIEYAKKYMEILNSLKPGGTFYYAPDLPFIEQYLDEKTFSVTQYDLEDLPCKVSGVKRLQ